MLFEIFEFAGITAFSCFCIAVFFAFKRKFKLHKIFAIAGFFAALIHVSIRFLFLK